MIDFWHWRSNEWDGSWLSIMGGEKEILEWFPQFLQHVGVEIDEEEEEKPKPKKPKPALRSQQQGKIRHDKTRPGCGSGG